MKRLTSLIPARLGALVLAATLGCAGDGGVADDENDSFGGADAKADGNFSACQLSEVLNFMNESETTPARLTRHGLKRSVADDLVAHRAGPDGTIGTGDDDLYDDLNELDGVPFVGIVVLDHLVAAILPRCEVDLATRPFIDAATFGGSTGGGFTRDSVEIEATLRVGGITGPLLRELLRTERNGRTTYDRIAKARIMESFTYGYGVDEMPWDGDSHAAREGLKFLPLTIESSRYIADAGESRELDLGVDIMDDIYFDTFDYRLLRTDTLLRGRLRWDGPDIIRRLLIGAKFSPTVDMNGLKRAAKVDVRNDGASESEVKSIETDVMQGKVAWNGSPVAIEPVEKLYLKLKELDVLPTIGQHQYVLVLDPKVHLRSTRSRYHLDLAQTSSMQNFYAHGRQQIRDLAARAQAALGGTLTAAQRTQVQALIDLGNAIDSGQAVADRARAGLLAIDPGMSVTVANLTFPDEMTGTAASRTDVEKNRVVAETVDALFHEFGQAYDALDRIMTGTTGLAGDEYVEQFVLWRKTVDTNLVLHRTHRQFLARHKALDADRAGTIAAFNTFGEAQEADNNRAFRDFEAIDDTLWAALGQHLEFEALKESQRQAESAGSMAQAIWFEQARRFYVPSASRPFGNFMIDTMDMTEMMSRAEWLSIPEAERGKIDQPIDAAKLFHTTLVNDVQIELGNEEPYVNRIDELSAKVTAGTASDEERRLLDGSLFVFQEMVDSLTYLSAVKGDNLLEELDDAGAPNTIEWEVASESKGTSGLRRLGDLD